MSFTKLKVSGYGFNDVFTSAQANYLNDAMPNIVDGGAGGTYTPSAPLSIGGSGGLIIAGINGGLAASAVFTLSNGSAIVGVSGSVIRGTFAFGDGTADAVATWSHGALTFASGTTLHLQSGSSLTIDSGTTVSVASSAGFSGTVNFTGSVLVNTPGNVTVNTQLTMGASSHLAFASGADMTGTVAMAAAMSNTGVISNSGAGHYNLRPAFQMTDADATKGVNDCDTVFVQDTVFTANHSLTVTSTGAVSGSRMRVYMNHQANTLTLKQDNASTITTLKNAVGFYVWVDLEHNGSANGWFLIGGWSR